MKTMAISEFKTHALKIIDQISKNHETISRRSGVVRMTPGLGYRPQQAPQDTVSLTWHK